MSAPDQVPPPVLSPGWWRGRARVTCQSHRVTLWWWLICIQCPQSSADMTHDGLSRRRQLISALHHIPGLVIHQTESCICIINCCSFTVCFPNCPLCSRHTLYSYHATSTKYYIEKCKYILINAFFPGTVSCFGNQIFPRKYKYLDKNFQKQKISKFSSHSNFPL